MCCCTGGSPVAHSFTLGAILLPDIQNLQFKVHDLHGATIASSSAALLFLCQEGALVLSETHSRS